jgi:3-phosphoshikimate 1-carboxyvinyltransferase
MSTSKDSEYLAQVLSSYSGDDNYLGAGGTTLRFAAAYWAIQEGAQMTLRGTEKLNTRPIAHYVAALNALGAEVSYAEVDGQAPLFIQGVGMTGGHFHMGHVESSQFVTALMIIAPLMTDGMKLTWDSIPSTPYLLMTAALLRQVGFEVELSTKGVVIAPGQEANETVLLMEPDWSAVAFWCEAVALSESAHITLLGFKEESLQGDRKVIQYFEPLGVQHHFTDQGLELTKVASLAPGQLIYNLIGEPDVAQALVMALVFKRIPFEINGLYTLRLKETDRITALEEVLNSFGVHLESTPTSVRCLSYPDSFKKPTVAFSTYEDHRVAMSLAPVSLLFDISLHDASVVEKSYPEFWKHWSSLK